MTDKLTPEQKIEALAEEFKPRFTELFRSIGMEVSDDISNEELAALLNDQATFEAALPEGLTLETLPPEFIEKFQELAMEYLSKVQAIMLEQLFG